MERKKITFDSFIRGVILGVIIIGILMLLKRLSSVLLPFFIAWLIAYLVYPLVTFFQYKLKLRNRIVSIFCALLTLLIVGAGAFYLLVPPMIQECGRVQTLLVQYFSHGTYNSNVPTSLSDFLRDNIDVKSIKRTCWMRSKKQFPAYGLYYRTQLTYYSAYSPYSLSYYMLSSFY